MDLLSSALITIEEYEILSGVTLTNPEKDRIIGYINYVTVIFEKFCNRFLKARNFTHVIVTGSEEDFNDLYSVFDGPKGDIFFFPTYPVNSITEFKVSDTVIAAATSYDDSTGYHLYSAKGKLKFYGGFDFGHVRNVKVKWNGGYAATTNEMDVLKFLCFDMIKTILSAPKSGLLQSEKIGNYSYSLLSPEYIKQLSGLNPMVFAGLSRFRKEVI